MNVKLSSFSAKNEKMEAKLKSNEELIKNLTNHTADIYKQHDRQVEENKQMKLSLKKLLAASEELQTTNGTLTKNHLR